MHGDERGKQESETTRGNKDDDVVQTVIFGGRSAMTNERKMKDN